MTNHLQLECVVVKSVDALHNVVTVLLSTAWFGVYRGLEDDTWQVVYDSKRAAEVKQAIAAYMAACHLATVTIEVLGGVASVTEVPPGIDVKIVDHDIEKVETVA